MFKYAIFFVSSFFCFAGITSAQDIGYKLSLEINGKLASSDSFVNRKASDSTYPDAIETSFNSDEMTLKIEFRPSAKTNVKFKQYTCNFALQTRSGNERFNFEKSSKSTPVATLTNNGAYLCEFQNITKYSNVEHEVSPIEGGETYLFEAWVKELGKNWTYLPIIAKEASEWPNRSIRSTAKALAD